MGFLERVVDTPRARHTPEKTDRRVELCRFSRFSKLIPRRRIGLSRFSRFVSKSWQNDAPGRSFVYMHKWSLPSSSPSFPSLFLRRPGRARPGRAGPGRTRAHLAVRPGLAGPAAPAAPGRAASGSYRARPGFGTRQAARLRRTRPGRASACDRRPGFGTRPGFGAHDRARFRHATGGRAQERDQASANTTGPGFGTPLAQLIPRRGIGLCRRFPRFLQLSTC